MTEIVELNLLGLQMSGIDQPDRGFIWTDLTGWWGLPDLRGDTDPIPGAHGSFRRFEAYRESRAITLVGHVYCESNAEMHARRDELERVLGGAFGDLTVTTTGYGMWSRGVEVQNLEVVSDRGRRWVRFTVDMVANDPRRYQALSTLGPVTSPVLTGGVRFPQPAPFNFGTVAGGAELVIENVGGVPLKPTVRVEGAFSSVTVTDVVSGRVLALDWPVAGGAVFDCAARRATSDGGVVTREMSSRQWFEIPPGGVARLRIASDNPDVLMFADFQIGAW